MTTKKISWTPLNQVFSQPVIKFALQYFITRIIAKIGGEN